VTDQGAEILGEDFPIRARLARPLRVSMGRKEADSARDAAELSGRIARVAKGGARAAVIGLNDGLVTNICLILAVAGANASAGDVRLAGFASLVAGALSMAAGEWVSVRGQVELYTGLLNEVRGLVDRNPKLILNQLSERLEAAGLGGPPRKPRPPSFPR
jgi:vacuolar iron transporter family protein